MITDYFSFIAGVQVGRRLRIWDASRIKQKPAPPEEYILAEDDTPIVTEVAQGGAEPQNMITE